MRGVDDPFSGRSALHGKSYRYDPSFFHLLYSIKKVKAIEPEDIIAFIKPKQLLILDAETFHPLNYYSSKTGDNISVMCASGLYYVVSG